MKATTEVISKTGLLRVALLQLSVFKDKEENLKNAVSSIEEAAKQKGAKLVVLPECFNSPYGALQSIEGVTKYAEDYDESVTLETISKLADELDITIVAGSIPTKEGSGFFNTSCSFGPDGKLLAKHQKIHLFDINIPGKIVYEESKILTGGNNLSMFEIPNTDFKVGVGICFDIRFPELSQIYQRNGCNLLVFPGAFNMTTGPAHWELLARTRAVDNQCFVCLCSPARDTNAKYVAWGHSMITSPWGEIMVEVEAQDKNEILITDIDLKKVNEIREQLPVVRNKSKKYYDVTFSTDSDDL